MNKNVEIKNKTEWMTLYTILSDKERELQNALKDHKNGVKELFSAYECELMLVSVKELLSRL